jgi:glycerol-3-phosphate dehydrogenase
VKIRDHYDVVVVGAGIHGAALAWELTRRGISTALLEQDDFGSGASANSLKIIHGGLRYLQHLDWVRSRQSAQEQQSLRRLAPHLIRALPCVMPTYRGLGKSRAALFCGLSLYENLIRPNNDKAQDEKSALITREQLQTLIPISLTPDMTGGAIWYDAQVYNTERLTLSYVITAMEQGADVFNYVKVNALEIKDGYVVAALSENRLTGDSHRFRCSVLVNATGADIFEAPFESVLKHVAAPRFVRAVNLILPGHISDYAVGLSVRSNQTQGRADDRLLFFTPWGQSTIVGTWYFPDRRDLGHAITRDELQQCVRDVSGRFRNFDFDESDVCHIHIGRLPTTGLRSSGTAKLLERSRIIDSKAEQGVEGLLSVVSIKYTTARLVAEQSISLIRDKIDHQTPREILSARLCGGEIDDFEKFVASKTRQYGDRLSASTIYRLARHYGTHIDHVVALMDRRHALREIVPGSEDVLAAEIHYAMESEKAFTLNDVILRRTGLGHLGRPPQETLDYCIDMMASHYQWDDDRRARELNSVAASYDRVVDT